MHPQYVRRMWGCDCVHEDAHVEARAERIADAIDDYITHVGPDPDELDPHDIASELAAAGLFVPVLEVAGLALIGSMRLAEHLAVHDAAWQDDDEAETFASRTRSILRCHRIVERNELIPAHEWRAREWYRVQGLSAEGRCRGCEGGTAELCRRCRQDGNQPMENEMTDTTDSTDSTIDSILTKVATPAPMIPADIPATVHHAAALAAQRAFFRARSEDKTTDEARAIQRDAYEQTAREMMGVAEVRCAVCQALVEAVSDEGACDECLASFAPTEPAAADVGEGEMDAVGRARSERDVADLRAAGFEMRETVYERGTRVIAWGVENAHAKRVAWEAKPEATAALSEFVGHVLAEERRDVTATLTECAMRPDDGALRLSGEGYRLTETGAEGLITRLGCGGARYILDKCPAELRALNVNHWLSTSADREAVFRTRKKSHLPGVGSADTEREIFATVSTGYTPFDVDRVASALSLALPPGLRGQIRYDGERASFEFTAHSDVKPEHYVAGEVFEVGIKVRAGDTGGNGIAISSIATQNLCLNLIILDRAALPIDRLIHLGDFDKLVKRFRKAVVEASNAVGPFLRRWNRACEESIALDGMGAREAMERTFAGLWDTKAVRIPGKGAAETVATLLSAWEQDMSSATAYAQASRAAVVNAITRAAHTLTFDDPWATDELEQAGARLLWPRRGDGDLPAVPLPQVELDDVLKRELTSRAN